MMTPMDMPPKPVESAPALDFTQLTDRLNLFQDFLLHTVVPWLVLMIFVVALVKFSWQPLLLWHYRRVAQRRGYQREEARIWAHLRAFWLVARRHKIGVNDPHHTPNPRLTGEEARKDKPSFFTAKAVGEPGHHPEGVALVIKPAYGQKVSDLAEQIEVYVALEIRERFSSILQGEEVIIEEKPGRVLLIVQTQIPGQQQPAISLLD